MPSKNETRVAVFLGGRSPEHDVSVITGLQALKAIDQERFIAFPVYVNPRGAWFVGEALAERRNYLPDARTQAELIAVTLSLGEPGRGVLVPKRTGLFGRRTAIEFDAALLAFHGLGGEDGQIQGLFETANVPYTGMRTLASALLMDKAATKRLLRGLDIPMLGDAVVTRGSAGLPSADALSALLGNMGFPCIVKPAHLGSSIGVGKADDVEDVRALLPAIFRLDRQAVIEPFDFRQKYLSGGDGKGGVKGDAASSQGMLSLTREINPALPADLEEKLRRWAIAAFEAVDGTGAPRVDFYCNEKTGETWLNEVNPCPGSFAYFLWEATDPPIGFTSLLSMLIDEALSRHREGQLPDDPVPPEARLLQRS